jgi:hypothetical protein
MKAERFLISRVAASGYIGDWFEHLWDVATIALIVYAVIQILGLGNGH